MVAESRTADWCEAEPTGNRLQEIIDADGGGPNPATTTKFAFEAGNAWADLDNAANLTTRRLYLDAVDALFARIDGSTINFYLGDRLGSVGDIIDTTAAVVKSYRYDSFGKITATGGSNPNYADAYTWTGRPRNDTSGLQDNRGRWYSFDIGRFINQDPIGFAAGDANLYRYVGNSPTNRTDPTGFAWGFLEDAWEED